MKIAGGGDGVKVRVCGKKEKCVVIFLNFISLAGYIRSVNE